LNKRITLGLRHNQALMKEKILSKQDFPIEIEHCDNTRVRVLFLYDNNQKIFKSYISALSDYIIEQYEIKLLKRILFNRYGTLKPFQLKSIISHLPELDADEIIGREKRKEAVKSGLYQYFAEHDSGNVEGLVTFRLCAYEALLTHVAEQLIEHYLTYKEYEEFIELLRYFVNIQQERPHLAHLLVQSGGMYTILNENKEDITKECISEFARPEEIGQEHFDDLLISILITLAPEKIIVHNGADIKNVELFETIHKVFGELEYCAGCETCVRTKMMQK